MLKKHLWISHSESTPNPVFKRRVVMKRILLVVLMVLTGVSLYSCATTNSLTSIPLPENVQIVPPDPNLPPEIKAFSGKWSGRWGWQDRRNNDGVDAVLIVEKIISEQQAMVVVANGNGIGWKTLRSWERSTANFSKTEEGISLMVDSTTSSRKIKFGTKRGSPDRDYGRPRRLWHNYYHNDTNLITSEERNKKVGLWQDKNPSRRGSSGKLRDTRGVTIPQ
jgi:hypothetical protein